jgi:hypothetical protein
MRNHEFFEMQQRLQAAMARISDLESTVMVLNRGIPGSPGMMRSPGFELRGLCSSPALGLDDVRVSMKVYFLHLKFTVNATLFRYFHSDYLFYTIEMRWCCTSILTVSTPNCF